MPRHVPKKNAPTRLKQLLQQRQGISDVELADAIIPHLEKHGRLIVFDEQRLWQYEPNEGIFVLLDDAVVVNFIFDLDGTRTPNGRLKISETRANSVLRAIKRRLSNPGYFFSPPEGISVANGFLTIEGDQLTLKPHRVDQRQRARLDINYDPTSDTNDCDNFLRETFADQSLVDLIYEVTGVALFGYGDRFQTLIIFYGTGANGKGVTTKLIEQLIPENMRSSVSPSEWLYDFHRVHLAGSRFNSVGELPPLQGRHMEMLKSICAGDTTTVRRVGETGFKIKPIALHVFSTNHLPPLPETGEAIRRRMLVVPFTRTVPPEKRNPKLAEEVFERGGQGLLRRAVEGFQRVLKRGSIARPATVRHATRSWLHRSNPAKVFAETHLVRTGQPKDRISAADMFTRCCEFCANSNLPIPSSERALRSSLEVLGFSIAKSSTMYWIGVQFQNPP